MKQQAASYDWLPADVRSDYGLGDWVEDLQEVHQPKSGESYQRACLGLALRVRG